LGRAVPIAEKTKRKNSRIRDDALRLRRLKLMTGLRCRRDMDLRVIAIMASFEVVVVVVVVVAVIEVRSLDPALSHLNIWKD
jgi:hypothetical protein